MERYNGVSVVLATNAALPGATIAVYASGTLIPSEIFEDNGITPLANPFTSDAVSGLFGFYAADGTYDITISKTGATTYTIPAVTLIATAAGLNQLTGDVTAGPGTGAQVATIAADAVTNAKLADMAALTVKVNATNGAANPTDLALSDGNSTKRVGTALVSAGYGPASTTVLTSGTAQTYTVPAGIYRLRVRLIGGGAGGGGAAGTTSGIGGGGGAGGYCEKLYSVTPAQTFLYTVGALGAGGTAGNNSGSPGGDTTFDNGGAIVTGSGGSGGASMSTGSTFAAAAGGIGGAATGGTINIAGGRGQTALRMGTSQFSLGAGAPSPLGAGGIGNVNTTGGVASGYGCGGGGASASSGVANQAGGAGTNGVILIDEFN